MDYSNVSAQERCAMLRDVSDAERNLTLN